MPKRISVGESVTLQRDISRREDPEYGKKGDEGVVLDLFKSTSSAMDAGTLHAKIRMTSNNQIKTFRLTSLAKTGAP